MFGEQTLELRLLLYFLLARNHGVQCLFQLRSGRAGRWVYHPVRHVRQKLKNVNIASNVSSFSALYFGAVAYRVVSIKGTFNYTHIF